MRGPPRGPQIFFGDSSRGRSAALAVPVNGVGSESALGGSPDDDRDKAVPGPIDHLGRVKPRDEFVCFVWRQSACAARGSGSREPDALWKAKRREGADIVDVRSPSSLADTVHPRRESLPRSRHHQSSPSPAQKEINRRKGSSVERPDPPDTSGTASRTPTWSYRTKLGMRSATRCRRQSRQRNS